MDNYVTGNTIKKLREQKNLTQKELADMILVSDKTVSKWENGRGYPDIGILEQLAKALQINIVELITGEVVKNENVSSNMRKIKYYVCPMCGNVISSIGEVQLSCCGIQLPVLETEDSSVEHGICVERIEHEYFVSVEHDMSKKHYISFIAYVTNDRMQLCKLYPEQNAETRFLIKGHGDIYVYCNKHGLFSMRV